MAVACRQSAPCGVQPLGLLPTIRPLRGGRPTHPATAPHPPSIPQADAHGFDAASGERLFSWCGLAASALADCALHLAAGLVFHGGNGAGGRGECAERGYSR
jgi:hypothetical protein